jgi:hypothetical protein
MNRPGGHSLMGVRQHAALLTGLAIVWALGISVLRSNCSSDVRLFNDNYDRAIYSMRGAWALNHTVPYRDVPSEYPQLATYLFGVPYLVARRASRDSRIYSDIVSGIMLGFLYGAIVLLYRMLPARKGRAYLMLLPGALYFSYNRFDIVPGLLVLTSLFFLQRGSHIAAAVCLASGALTKWYPGLLLFTYVAYRWTIDRRLDRKMILVFVATCLALLVPTAVAGGIAAVMQPYIIHANRGFALVTLPGLIMSASQWLGVHIEASVLTYTFLASSLVPVAFSAFSRIETFEQVTDWAIIVIGSFVLFSRIWSPQWVLWLLPLMILTARTPSDIRWIVTYGVLSYVSFPLVFDFFGPESGPLMAVAALVFAVIARTIVTSIRRLMGAPLGK